MGDGATTESYYEYDYNEIIGPSAKLPLSDIKNNPDQYLDYVYTETETQEQFVERKISEALSPIYKELTKNL